MTDIAVLLPCYNPPSKELESTLQSLRLQSVPFRLYLVDDGSKSKTDYDAFLDGIDARVIMLPKNLGITGAMNAGLVEILKGSYRYIVRIDCGDTCAPDRFARQLAFMKANSSVGIVGSAVEFILVDAEGELQGRKTMPYPESHEGCIRRLYLNSSIIHPAMMIRREVFEKLEGYSEEYPAAEDYDLLWRTAANGFRLANLPQVLITKEETPGSISQLRRRRQIFNRLRIQWHNLQPLQPRAWLGLAKSVATWLAPASLVHAVKFLKG
jgi:glycosyltransferase involved in cell wall biosynthesis